MRPEAPEYDVVMRLVVTRRVQGEVPAQRKHKLLTSLKHLLSLVGPTRGTYRIDVAEVAEVTRVRETLSR